MTSGKLIFIFVFFFSLVSYSVADELIMKDDRVLKGRVVQINDKNVRYEPEPGKAEEIPVEGVKKIRYDDGREFTFAGMPPLDSIYLYDGVVLKGRIQKVTERYVSYTADDSKILLVINRDLAARIVFGDGRPIELMVGDDKKGDEKKSDVKKDGKKEKPPRFTAGLRIGRIKWYPVWRRERDSYTGLYQNKSIRPMLSYQPEILFAINEKLKIFMSGSFASDRRRNLVNLTSHKTLLEMSLFYYYYLPAVPSMRLPGNSLICYERTLEKYDSKIAINLTVIEKVDLVFGARYQGYYFKQRGSKTIGVGYLFLLPPPSSYVAYHNSPYDSRSKFSGIGPEVGFSLKYPIGKTHYLSPKITAFLLSFNEKNESLYFAGGNAKGIIAGFASSCVFGIILPGTGVSFELGAGLDYLIYHINRSSIYTGRSKSVRDETLGYNAAVFYSL